MTAVVDIYQAEKSNTQQQRRKVLLRQKVQLALDNFVEHYHRMTKHYEGQDDEHNEYREGVKRALLRDASTLADEMYRAHVDFVDRSDREYVLPAFRDALAQYEAAKADDPSLGVHTLLKFMKERRIDIYERSLFGW